jgi:PAS domain S-box-containing protein
MAAKPSYEKLEQRVQELEQQITESKKALRDSEDQSRLLAENSSDIIYILDIASERYTYVSPSVERILGYTRDEVLSMQPKDVLTSESYQYQLNELSTALQDSSQALPASKILELELLHKDGSVRWGEIHARLIEDATGQPRSIIGICRDVTERKKAEKALRESEERYRILSEESPIGIALIDKEGEYRYINPKFTEIFGYTYEDIPTGREWFRKAYPDREYRHQVISTWINDKKHWRIGEARPRTFTVTCKNGTEKTVHFKSVTMKSGNQLVICEDMTEKERLEAQLQRAQKMEALGTLAGGVAHDLNNILLSLVGYPDLLLMQLPEDSRLREPLITIKESGFKAAAIVQDLLTLARGRGGAEEEVVNINEIITGYLKSPEYEKLRSFHPHVKVKTDLSGDILNISGSRVHLTKTVMNLVSNGAEAMSEGGELRISTENRYLDRPIEGYDRVEEGDHVILSVSDHGIGIPKEDVEKIFEPFYTKKKMGRSGTGLGMAVVWGTVKDHRGYIDIETTEGKGTTVCLYFPATREALAKDKSLGSPEQYKGTGESILVVDDVKEQRDIASTMLSELGYSVSTVSSGEEAIEYLKEHTADLLVLDMIMDPGIDGLDTYRKILDLNPHQKAIIVSGFSETKRVKEAQNLGAGQYIRKPYTMEKIGIAVSKELEKNRKLR